MDLEAICLLTCPASSQLSDLRWAAQGTRHKARLCSRSRAGPGGHLALRQVQLVRWKVLALFFLVHSEGDKAGKETSLNMHNVFRPLVISSVAILNLCFTQDQESKGRYIFFLYQIILGSPLVGSNE